MSDLSPSFGDRLKATFSFACCSSVLGMKLRFPGQIIDMSMERVVLYTHKMTMVSVIVSMSVYSDCMVISLTNPEDLITSAKQIQQKL